MTSCSENLHRLGRGPPTSSGRGRAGPARRQRCREAHATRMAAREGERRGPGRRRDRAGDGSRARRHTRQARPHPRVDLVALAALVHHLRSGPRCLDAGYPIVHSCARMTPIPPLGVTIAGGAPAGGSDVTHALNVSLPGARLMFWVFQFEAHGPLSGGTRLGVARPLDRFSMSIRGRSQAHP